MHPTCAHAPMFAHVPHVCLYYMRNITQLGENLLDVRCADHYSTAIPARLRLSSWMRCLEADTDILASC